ncbi:MAG: signal peptidase II [Acidimicrobiia bacterium]|nr:signal peptidase II [Acidimicrobiia bacterium]MYE72515.1 signal peptidase II [Acidimicrobiia bacterium]MYJ62655.1 signal peptidase II [Acidimicrobiia bacterium]
MPFRGRRNGLSTKPVGFRAVTPTETKRRSRRHNLVLLGVAAFVVAVDQLTKWWALVSLDDRDIDLVWTLRLNLVHNTGAAFGLGQGLEAVIAVLALVFVVVVAWASWGGRRLSLPPVLLGMILGGAIGNLADRALRSGDGFLGGAVVDFVDLQWWPVFNAADSAIVVAGVILVLTAPRYRQPTDEPQGATTGGDTEPDPSNGP